MRAVLGLVALAVGGHAFAPAQPARKLVGMKQGLERLSPLFLNTADFKNGITLDIDGVPWRLQEFLHVKPGKGSAFVRTKLKNLVNGNVNEKTWRAGESISLANIEFAELQYTYAENENYVFMNTESFEEQRVPKSACADQDKYFKEGVVVKVQTWNGKTIGVQLPTSMSLKVIECDPNIKGATASGNINKPAKLETGAVVKVPGFIKEGEIIIVNTETDEYLGVSIRGYFFFFFLGCQVTQNINANNPPSPFPLRPQRQQ
jgi:translation elongation factor P